MGAQRRVFIFVLTLACVAGGSFCGSNEPRRDASPAERESVAIHQLGYLEITNTELFDESDVVVTGLVQSVNDYTLADEPHLVGSLNTEQQTIASRGARVREVVVTVLSTQKGSPPATIRVVAGLSGAHVGVATVSELPEIVDLQVGAAYTLYLMDESVWFTGDDHFVYVWSEAAGV